MKGEVAEGQMTPDKTVKAKKSKNPKAVAVAAVEEESGASV